MKNIEYKCNLCNSILNPSARPPDGHALRFGSTMQSRLETYQYWEDAPVHLCCLCIESIKALPAKE